MKKKQTGEELIKSGQKKMLSALIIIVLIGLIVYPSMQGFWRALMMFMLILLVILGVIFVLKFSLMANKKAKFSRRVTKLIGAIVVALESVYTVAENFLKIINPFYGWGLVVILLVAEVVAIKIAFVGLKDLEEGKKAQR